MPYAQINDVTARLGDTPVSAEMRVNITRWLAHYEGKLLGRLRDNGIEATYEAGTVGATILKNEIAAAVAGEVRRAIGSSAGNPEFGKAEIDGFYAFLKWIDDEPRGAAVTLAGAAASAASSTSNSHVLTTSEEDFPTRVTLKDNGPGSWGL